MSYPDYCMYPACLNEPCLEDFCPYRSKCIYKFDELEDDSDEV